MRTLTWRGLTAALLLCATPVLAGEWLPSTNAKKAGFDAARLERIAPVMQRHVDDGRLAGAAMVIARDGKVVYNGKLASLRRIDEDAKEVKSGFECGMTLENYQDIKEGDTMEFVEIEYIKRKLGDT